MGNNSKDSKDKDVLIIDGSHENYRDYYNNPDFFDWGLNMELMDVSFEYEGKVRKWTRSYYVIPGILDWTLGIYLPIKTIVENKKEVLLDLKKMYGRNIESNCLLLDAGLTYCSIEADGGNMVISLFSKEEGYTLRMCDVADLLKIALQVRDLYSVYYKVGVIGTFTNGEEKDEVYVKGDIWVGNPMDLADIVDYYMDSLCKKVVVRNPEYNGPLACTEMDAECFEEKLILPKEKVVLKKPGYKYRFDLIQSMWKDNKVDYYTGREDDFRCVELRMFINKVDSIR